MIAVTGATGHLGRLVVTGLLDAGVPAAEVTASQWRKARVGRLPRAERSARRGGAASSIRR